MKIAIFGRTIERESFPRLSLLLQRICAARDISIAVYSPFYNFLQERIKGSYSKTPDGKIISSALKDAAVFSCSEDVPQGTDLFLSLGGDGTFLNCVALVRDRNIPIAGINFGRLGFLTTAKVADRKAEAGDAKANQWIEKLLTKRFVIERRSMLKVEGKSLPENFYPYALNEIAIQRSGASMIQLDIKIDGMPVPGYLADGVLVSSATGSTAYALSVGGPIVMPQSKVLLIVPIAPHNLNIRPIVVTDNSKIEIEFSARSGHALLSADNRSFEIASGSKVKISKGRNCAKLVLTDDNFFKALNEKLYWGADKRNFK